VKIGKRNFLEGFVMQGKRHTLTLFIIFTLILQIAVFAQKTKKNPRKKYQRFPVQTPYQHKFGLGGYGSVIKMVLGDVDHCTIEQWFGLSANYFPAPQFSFSANVAYGWVYPRDPKGSQFSAVSHYKTILIPFSLVGRLSFMTDRPVLPYLTVGLGATYWDVRDIAEVKDSVFYPGRTVFKSKITPTLVGGMGYEIYATPSFALDFGVRYSHLLKGNEDTIGTGDDNRGIIEFHFRIVHYWNNKKDSDKDGILDKYDADPFAPEDFDGFKDFDGVPDLDNDNDGVPDRFDKAPQEPEDKDGFQDDDGIPDPDNDKDGISDRKDKCPNYAEDFDGYQDEDGCPESDNDGDGISDEKDKCPNYPETVNGYEDEDGCPDEKPTQPKAPPMPKKVPIQMKGLNFRSGSARLLPGADEKLFEIGRIMLEHPEIRIEIRGYTDNVGSARSNLRLSQKRAETIKRFLVNHGIASNRIRATGFGEANPIATNATAAGRAKNRRIEFIRID
jgi:outer membrane protein OmpA-like peptidoglycan-associated protein/opacity protein-like surface antigen